MPRVHYRTTRPLDPKKDTKLYVERPEDKTVAACVQRRDYVTLIGARRMGTTSLLHRLQFQLAHDCIPAFVDLMPFKESGKEWYRHVAEKMLDQLQGRIGVSKSKRTKLLGFASDHIGFSKFLGALAKEAKPTDRIIVMFDEVGMVPLEIADPLFRALRAGYSNRANSEFDRYIFVFAGAFEPADLIRSGRGSIFQIAKKVYMTDTDISGVRQLVVLLDSKVSDKTVRYIYEWTGGHLYLTQRLCSILDDQEIVKITKDSVDQAVTNIIAGDDSVVHIRERLNNDESAKSTLRKVLAGKRLKWGNTMARKLNLIGVVKRDDKHNCVIRNRIFEEALRDYFGEEERKPIYQRIWKFFTLLVALLALFLVLWLLPNTSDVVQAKFLNKSNQTQITGLQDSRGNEIEATIYSPRLLDLGQPRAVDIVIHSLEKPIIELVSSPGSDIVVAQDRTNPYKFTIEWRDTSPGILPVRWIEQHQIDVIATMPITGSQQVATPIFAKTNYLSSLFALLASGIITIVASIVTFSENIQKLRKMFSRKYTKREAGSQQ